MLIGLGKMVKKVAGGIGLLASRVLGFTNVTDGGSSYYTTTVGTKGPGYLTHSYNGLMAYSSDGVEWTTGNNFNSSSTKGGLDGKIAYGNGAWVIASQGDFFYSLDGISWNKSDLPNGEGFDPIFVNDKFYAYGGNSSPKLYVSSNGINWSLAYVDYSSLGTSYDAYVGGINYISNPLSAIKYVGFMAGTFNQPGSSEFKFIPITSIDGINWSITSSNFENLVPTTLNGSSYTALSGNVVFSSQGNVYLSIFSTGDTFYSSDLSTWNYSTKFEHDTQNGLRIFVDSNGLIGYFPKSGSAQRTYDGMTWESHPRDTSWIPGQFEYLPPIKFGNDYWVYTTTGGSTLVYHSDNGWWDEIFSSTPPYAALSDTSGVLVSGALSFNGKIIIYNYYGAFIYSLDGYNWTTGGDFDPNGLDQWYPVMSGGEISTLIEVQVSIGNQGSEGAEILAPVDIYAVPAGKTTDLSYIRLVNTSNYPISVDIGILNSGVELTQQNISTNDWLIPANSTSDVLPQYLSGGAPSLVMTAGQRIVILPSSVDTINVSVYGTES